MKLTYKFYLRFDKNDRNKATVYLRITVNRKHVYKSITRLTDPRMFDESLQIIKGRSSEAVQGNLLIKKYKDILSDFLIKVYNTGESVTLRKVYQLVNSDKKSYSSFFDYCYNELLPKKKNSLKYGGYKKYLTEVNKLKEFAPNLTFADLDDSFTEDYFNFLVNEKKNNLNTSYRAIRQLKAIVNNAVKDGYIHKNVITFKAKQIKGQREFLTKNELVKLHDSIMSIENKKLFNVGKYFLFSCYTGLRYSDIKQLKWKHINESTIRIKMQKTNEEIFVPLNNRALGILEYQDNKTDSVFRVYSNQKTNSYLKDIAKIAGIDKLLTFHVARHTFATVSLELGIPIEVVSKMLGHQDIKTTLIYARIVDTLKINEMKKWNF